MKRSAFTLVELLVVIVILAILAGLTIPAAQKVFGDGGIPALQGPVNDHAKIFTADQKERLGARLLAQEEATSDQIVILTVESLGGDTIEAYANHVFHTWKLGQADKDNGVLLLAAIKDRKMRIEVGKGLEGRLTDAIASRIIRDQMAPRFKQKDYFGGFDAAVTSVLGVVKGEFKAGEGGNVAARANAGNAQAAGGWPTWVWVVIAIVVIVVLFLLLATLGGLGGGDFGSIIGSSIGSNSGINYGGGGGGDSGGGYSGGGGDSGGGGASGSW